MNSEARMEGMRMDEPFAFDMWLKRGLRQQHNEVLEEALPNDLAQLVADMGAN